MFVRTLEAMFLNDQTSPDHLDSLRSAPLTPDSFLRLVLIPELSTCLIAEDMNVERTDPQVKLTLETSRAFGVAVFPMPEDIAVIPKSAKPDQTKRSTRVVVGPKQSHTTAPVRSQEKTGLVKPGEQRILSQFPALIIPYIKSVYDPPAFGNCGFYAIAHALRCHKEDSYVSVRRDLKQELITYRDIHEQLISTAPGMQSRRMVTQRTAPAATEIVDDLLHRLQPQNPTCRQEFWMRMPYLGYVIASVYECPVILFNPNKSHSYTFFPYRKAPNRKNPIILAFVDGNHFASLSAVPGKIPFPEIYGDCLSPTITATNIPEWINHYRVQLDCWTQSE